MLKFKKVKKGHIYSFLPVFINNKLQFEIQSLQYNKIIPDTYQTIKNIIDILYYDFLI